MHFVHISQILLSQIFCYLLGDITLQNLQFVSFYAIISKCHQLFEPSESLLATAELLSAVDTELSDFVLSAGDASSTSKSNTSSLVSSVPFRLPTAQTSFVFEHLRRHTTPPLPPDSSRTKSLTNSPVFTDQSFTVPSSEEVTAKRLLNCRHVTALWCLLGPEIWMQSMNLYSIHGCGPSLTSLGLLYILGHIIMLKPH